MKVYTRRDSATTVLRKMGIPKDKYHLFIVEAGGKFQVSIAQAQKYLTAPSVASVTKTRRKTDKVAVEPENKPKKSKASVPEVDLSTTSIAGTCAKLINAGKSNQEIWDIIQPMFKMGENKRHYPAWYRSHLRRKGVLSQTTRKQRQGIHVIYE